MGTPPDPREADKLYSNNNNKRPSTSQHHPSGKKPRRDGEGTAVGASNINGTSHITTTEPLSIVERLRCLESDFSAQSSRIAELETLVSALRGEVFGGTAAENTVDKAGAGAGAGAEAGGRVGGRGGRAFDFEEGESSSAMQRGSSRGGAEARALVSSAGGDGRIKEEDGWDAESRLYSASPPLTATQTTNLRMPHPIRHLPPIHHTLPLPKASLESFSHTILHSFFGGQPTSDGYYQIPRSRLQLTLKNPVKSWYVLTRTREPYAPPSPGHHGAKLSIFMQSRELEAESPSYNCPLFLHDEPGGDYTYYGSYREPRFSDRLDYSRMFDEVPESVRDYWAKTLTAKKRPAWVKEVFMDEGLISKELVTVNGVVDNDLAAELAEHIEAEDILKAFKTADADDEPSMRLYWEYLECVGYEVELHEALVAKKREMVERVLEKNEVPSP